MRWKQPCPTHATRSKIFWHIRLIYQQASSMLRTYHKTSSKPIIRTYCLTLPPSISSVQNLHIVSSTIYTTRNENSAHLEKLSGFFFQFCGPLLICFVSREANTLSSFTLSHYNAIKSINHDLGNAITKLPINLPITKTKITLEEWEKYVTKEDFYQYHYKTQLCSYNKFKHDWANCIYAHTMQDYRFAHDVEGLLKSTLMILKTALI